MSEIDELRELTASLARRARLSDNSDWKSAAASEKVSDLSDFSISPAAPAPVVPKIVKSEKSDTDKGAQLAELAREIHACRACGLGSARIQAVPGVGSPDAQVMFIGEGPGFDEDHKGEPFVGKSGQLLDKIMESIGLSRKTVFIANIMKCHPMIDPTDTEKRGNDRPPTPDEMAACRGWLEKQIRAIRPKVLVTLGASPAKALLQDPKLSITQIRGKWRDYDPGGGLPPVKLLPTFHPAALLRNPELKKDVWEDMKALRAELAS